MESVKTYRYKIKLAGDIDSKKIDLLAINLQKFDPVSISKPKSTPVQAKPMGFGHLENQSVTIIDVDFKYPATEPMIKQIAQLIGIDENSVIVSQADYADGMEKEIDKISNRPSPILTQQELEDEGKEASKAYGDSYLSSIKDQAKDDKFTYEIAGKEKTTDSYDPFAPKKETSKSPLSTIKRGPLPATGARK
jgi:hypothetical protein